MLAARALSQQSGLAHGRRRPTAAARCPSVHQRRCPLAVRAVQTTEKEAPKKSDAEVTTEKYGLEAGLLKAMQSKDGAVSAKQLLTQYGSAYLITSISFAAVSFAICYAAVSSGVDVAALLAKIGLQPNDTSETVGTFAIAYAAHKALSPVRFPPTVALTPIVAKYIGSKTNAAAGSGEQQNKDGQ